MANFDTTADVPIPKTTIERVIGQDNAVRFARIAVAQKRNLLLVGPPGTGKSMIGQAMTFMFPKPKYEISVVHNPNKSERPIVQIRTREDVAASKNVERHIGEILSPKQVPSFVSERLGFRCRRCSMLSSPNIPVCPHCGADKFKARPTPFDDMLAIQSLKRQDKIPALWTSTKGNEKTVIFERYENKIRMLNEKDLKVLEELQFQKKRKVIIPLDRPTFVQATGASEAELLGDVRHDPYGSHPEIGIPAYKRVVAGAVHDAHEGVLFIDEIATLGNLQRHILTAMQDKKFSITGRNPTSAGASVKVDNVPCDFIFIAASNVQQIKDIIAPLRSRIRGNGYEILMNTTMPVNPENKNKVIQFIAQEIIKDGRIPHADKMAVDELLNISVKYARDIDNVKGYTLRLRILAGIIKLAGDFAIFDKSKVIRKKHVNDAIKQAKSVEQQLTDKYGSLYKAQFTDFDNTKKKKPDIGPS
jgi:ATP-dependent Lon protease